MKNWRIHMTTLFLLFPMVAIADDNQSGNDKQDYTITMKKHEFSPFELVVPANQKVTVIVKNTDLSPIEFEGIQLGAKIVQPGTAVPISINRLEPGTYEYFDNFHDGVRGFITAK